MACWQHYYWRVLSTFCLALVYHQQGILALHSLLQWQFGCQRVQWWLMKLQKSKYERGGQKLAIHNTYTTLCCVNISFLNNTFLFRVNCYLQSVCKQVTTLQASDNITLQKTCRISVLSSSSGTYDTKPGRRTAWWLDTFSPVPWLPSPSSLF